MEKTEIHHNKTIPEGEHNIIWAIFLNLSILGIFHNKVHRLLHKQNAQS